MTWSKVGEWVKANAGPGAALVGSLLTGNVAGAVAAGVSLVTSATGHGDPEKVLEALQGNPETVLKLRELAYANEASIREHMRTQAEMEYKDKQAEHDTTQVTIRTGDTSADPYVRHTRPLMARQSWYGTLAYVAVMEAAKLGELGTGASLEIAMVLIAPAAAYMGFRTWDKMRGK
jgi:hypothetical protein